jgi:hypothetical protein
VFGSGKFYSGKSNIHKQGHGIRTKPNMIEKVAWNKSSLMMLKNILKNTQKLQLQ